MNLVCQANNLAQTYQVNGASFNSIAGDGFFKRTCKGKQLEEKCSRLILPKCFLARVFNYVDTSKNFGRGTMPGYLVSSSVNNINKR